ncbi:hypothetical protein P153DRAFT_376072 [Dothidotthia symphoricarpi CBS 119687]|uniref:Uncharacterized protein n=1 Tax=Dothidotthia symphoricarpi CBS 119687 TaxID=1392245 RepID=A0A6A6ACW1_9PLEO|nr:uncharacterized protein P153DRAFT_376072 [Dothidotthia symphoricarpi CBS 119687]KAF2129659.1 hypothetical protein P153DRAFT_376072 [Dothidotthia symphoricarpi CBS 119687]
MKRKRSQEPAVSSARKKMETQDDGTTSCLLVRILEQYGLLESIATNLFPEDLLSLALSSKAAYHTIFPRASSMDNLLGKLNCSGRGIQIRNNRHSKSMFFYAYECTEYVECGTKAERRHVRSQPCVKCKLATCDECRIHCVYQSIYETPSDSDELPNYSGFVLLEPLEVSILSPHHLALEDHTAPQWQNSSTGYTSPYHDQGFLDVPLEDASFADPESLSEILDLNLGKCSLQQVSTSSYHGVPSPVLRSFCHTTEARKISLCKVCFFLKASKGPDVLQPGRKLSWLRPTNTSTVSEIKPCQCTLRAHFLDRWTCLPCFKREEEEIRQYKACTPKRQTGLCLCGLDTHQMLCLWCWGIVKEQSN